MDVGLGEGRGAAKYVHRANSKSRRFIASASLVKAPT